MYICSQDRPICSSSQDVKAGPKTALYILSATTAEKQARVLCDKCVCIIYCNWPGCKRATSKAATHWETGIKTDDLVSFVKQWELCDVLFHVTQLFSVGKWYLCGTAVFFWMKEVSPGRQSSQDVSGSISLIKGIESDQFITVTWGSFFFSFFPSPKI